MKKVVLLMFPILLNEAAARQSEALSQFNLTKPLHPKYLYSSTFAVNLGVVDHDTFRATTFRLCL
ncbi:MAG: hypothetical protein HAW66_10685 [Shewanella sp.]|nr:hypothetical protein [Shewanella sp.]